MVVRIGLFCPKRAWDLHLKGLMVQIYEFLANKVLLCSAAMIFDGRRSMRCAWRSPFNAINQNLRLTQHVELGAQIS